MPGVQGSFLHPGTSAQFSSFGEIPSTDSKVVPCPLGSRTNRDAIREVLCEPGRKDWLACQGDEIRSKLGTHETSILSRTFLQCDPSANSTRWVGVQECGIIMYWNYHELSAWV